jgi:hypothetical protein
MEPCIGGMKNPCSTCTAHSQNGKLHDDPEIRPLGADTRRLQELR